MTLREELTRKRAEILAAAIRHGAVDIKLIGSLARGDATSKSDVDLLVTFRPSASVFARLDLQEELERILGSPVDIVVPDALHELIRNEVLREAVPV